MFNDLGTRLFKSVANKAGDLGDKFEEEFSQLSTNITTDVGTIVSEAISLSGYIKVTLVILCFVLVLIFIRLSAFGLRIIFVKFREWLKAQENKPPPQVILLMPTEDGKYRRSSTVYTDQQTKNLLDKIQQDSFELFNGDESRPSAKRTRAPRLGSRSSLKGTKVPEGEEI
ncbi:hypothetical protein WR25_04217 [Diploscapter pachys]|uniref:Uncharacterized protein n=1 Tax=Diploscapter pachys TaxID=2018661 RepID=A0A2A2K1A7_9BILA|nr:hypothetical protein WR25_04217 [Diploscapter pachys]